MTDIHTNAQIHQEKGFEAHIVVILKAKSGTSDRRLDVLQDETDA